MIMANIYLKSFQWETTLILIANNNNSILCVRYSLKYIPCIHSFNIVKDEETEAQRLCLLPTVHVFLLSISQETE